MRSVLLAGLGLLLALSPTTTLRAQSFHAIADTVFLMPRIDVVGQRDQLDRIPGSANVLDARALESSRVLSANEALRKLPGLAIREEEGFGLRPNIGIRGLNPTRSTKLTLLEDGVPLAYAPYGDNASYYHPPVERFSSIELMKGAGQVLFGPQTIGGVINYITPTPPVQMRGSITAAGGSRDYSVGRLQLGGHRMLLDATSKGGDGARENLDSRLDDISFKAVIARSLTLRTNYFRESSTVTYSGLTEAEYQLLGPRYNPFKNDRFEIRRQGGSLTHQLMLGTKALMTTNFYVSRFERDWWRQSSTTTDGQGGPGVVASRLAGARIDADTILSNQGRLREYTTWGLEPRVRVTYDAAGASHELQAGLKSHVERQDRRQVNGSTPTARIGTLAEDNLRRTTAWSAFVMQRSQIGNVTVTPGLRFEHIRSSRTNRLPGGLSGSDDLGTWIPSLGTTWAPARGLVLFAGAHAGFAPPRAEDVISTSGTSTEVEPEASTNHEIGARMGSSADSDMQLTLFRNDFERLTAVGSIAGGSTPLAQGRALFMGAEVSGRVRHSGGAWVRGAWTWVATAEQTEAFRQVVGGTAIAGSRAGLRQPYAPEHMITVAIGQDWHGFGSQLEAVHVGSQFADFANTHSASANGQSGRLPSATTWNATLEHAFAGPRATVFVAVKNLTDHVHIVDRTRGIQVAGPRTFQAGLTYSFSAAP